MLILSRILLLLVAASLPCKSVLASKLYTSEVEEFSFGQGYIPKHNSFETIKGKHGEIYEYYHIDYKQLPEVEQNNSVKNAVYMEIKLDSKAKEPSRKKLKTESLLTDIDRRTNITNPTQFPWVLNGRLEMEFESKDEDKQNIVCVGSGVMISPSCVLTCAHNLYLGEDIRNKYHYLKPYAARVEFFPGKAGTKVHRSSKANGYMISPEFPNSEDENEDLALLRLEDKLGRDLGYIATAPISNLAILKDDQVNVTGYPGELGNHMYTMKGPIKRVTDSKIYYEVDTTKGNSGSCVWKGDISAPICVGIHTTGEEYGCNGGVGITQAKFNLLSSWLQTLEPKLESKNEEE